jgi:hypothetical protein
VVESPDMTLLNLEGFNLNKATQIKNQLVAPGCLRARIISQKLEDPETEYLVMCGMEGVACAIHTLTAQYVVKSKGIMMSCPEKISNEKFQSLIR